MHAELCRKNIFNLFIRKLTHLKYVLVHTQFIQELKKNLIDF